MAANRSVGRTASSIGMMEGAFFVSRGDLLTWVNGLLNVNLTKVEQAASGAIYCQIIDACHPGSVAMRKVNWMSKVDHEFIPNYKVLQAAFDKNNIERYVDVDKLIRAKYQDNLEFLQWMKCYWEREGSGRRDYDPIQAREGKALPPWAQCLGGGLAMGGAANRSFEKENLRPASAVVKSVAAPEKRPGTAGRAPATKPAAVKTPTPRSQAAPFSNRAGTADSAPQSTAATEELNSRVSEQQVELEDLRSTLDGLERERDYYFQKLRLVELFCTTNQAQLDPSFTSEKILADITRILYAEDAEEEGVAEPEVEQQTP